MKKFLYTMKRKFSFTLKKVKAQLTLKYLMTESLLYSQRGEGFVDTAIKILMAVVIGALVLAGLYALFGETVLPTLKQRIIDMFNFGN
ncbi:hypothetical protein Desdi_1717 [Desulfitobacterium dichloroeliminans LMG P-21439]|uniref:Uncharacterized protein n=1 Tax=Desulfitobacterium dichloroeliminans (strain LMG P-21439 / DCA1) TaxID=871963 RepID=L0F8B8_DESDL|nr:DUF6133 family protein [Desulfitobacterium dichloroeliminans]AGA69193.1 hypothetical protein Desdi_1717 [Desulfitobacterium dichloroeliminans LMG P-21439]